MKKHSVLVSSCVVTAILLLGVACAKKPNDAQMTTDVLQKYSQDSGLSTKQISVQANEGVITLTGTVDSEAQREAAARQAASEPGVKTVINNLQVANAMANAQTPAQQPPAQAASEPAAAADPTPEEKPDSGTPKKSKSRTHEERAARKASHDSGSQQMAANTPPPAPAAAPQENVTPVQATPPPPPPRKFIVDQGTQLTVRLTDAIDSEKNQTGDSFHATLNAPITSDGEEAIPAGADIVGHLVSVKSAGKFAGQSEVVLQVDSISMGGRTYNVQTDQYKKTGSSRGKNTAEKVGGGALVGTLIGALAGGGKGAAIGAAAGAGVGGGVQAATKSQQIKLPSETILNFTLQSPVTVVEAHGSNRQKLSDSQQQ